MAHKTVISIIESFVFSLTLVSTRQFYTQSVKPIRVRLSVQVSQGQESEIIRAVSVQIQGSPDRYSYGTVVKPMYSRSQTERSLCP